MMTHQKYLSKFKDSIIATILQAKVENLFDYMLVPQVDKRIRDLVSKLEDGYKLDMMKKITEIIIEIRQDPSKKQI